MATESERLRSLADRAFTRPATPTLGAGAPAVVPGPVAKTPTIMFQQTVAIPLRPLLRQLNPATKEPAISDEMLGDMYDEIVLEMGRRGIRK